MVWFLCTIVTLMPETAVVSFRTLAFFFPLLTSTLSSFNAAHSLAIFDHYSCFNSISVLRPSFVIEVSDPYSSLPLSSIFDNCASISSDESPCRTIPIQFLSCADSRILNFYRLSKISSDGIFDVESRTSSHLASNS